MNYDEAIEYIEECGKSGIVPGLDSIRELLRRLGNPQDKLRFIHIAGTNGKGSTLATLSSILRESKIKVGMYISPTICDYLERFRIGGRNLGRKDFCKYLEVVREAADSMTAEGMSAPTAFEVETALSFLAFLDKKVDIVLLECGMGGLMDATNVIDSALISVFAHIDMDHEAFLGPDLKSIAENKAGIIKPGTCVVSTVQYDEVTKVLQRKAEESGAEYIILKTGDIDKVKTSVKGTVFELEHKKYKTSLIGRHQAGNAATAIKVTEVLNGLIKANDSRVSGLKYIGEGAVSRGLVNTIWQARLDILSKKPLIVIDGAHNIDAANRLKETVKEVWPNKRIVLILGMFRDKAVDEVISILCEDVFMVLTVATPDSSRALPSVELAGRVRNVNERVSATDSVEEALEIATLMADEDTLILATGSLAYLGRVISVINRTYNK